MPGASRPTEFGTGGEGGPVSQRWRPPLGVRTVTVGGIGKPCCSARNRRAVRPSAPFLVSRSMPMRWCGGSPQASAVADGPRGGGEHPADGERVGARVVDAVPEPAALAAAGRDLGVPAVRGPDGRKLAAGQRDDGVAACGGEEGVAERGGVRILGWGGREPEGRGGPDLRASFGVSVRASFGSSVRAGVGPSVRVWCGPRILSGFGPRIGRRSGRPIGPRIRSNLDTRLGARLGARLARGSTRGSVRRPGHGSGRSSVGVPVGRLWRRCMAMAPFSYDCSRKGRGACAKRPVRRFCRGGAWSARALRGPGRGGASWRRAVRGRGCRAAAGVYPGFLMLARESTRCGGSAGDSWASLSARRRSKHRGGRPTAR